MPFRWIVAALLLLLVSLLEGCRRDDGPSVVVYVSVDDYVAQPILKQFEERTGIRVIMVGDTEAKKTTGLVERLRSERAKPVADVFWSSEVFMTVALANEGVFEPYTSPALANWPKQFRDADHRWYGFANRARVIAYAQDRVEESELPRTWMDLTQDRFRQRIVMADPRFGTTGGHLGAMKAYWDRDVMPGYFAAFAEGLAANGVRLLVSGNAGVVEAVAKGEADLGLTDTDDVWAAQARGLNVKLIYPNHNIERGAGGIGTLLIPNTVARVKGGPHQEAAQQLIDYLLSEDVERSLAQSVSHNIPVRTSLAAEFSDFAVADPLRVDYARAASMRTAAVQEFMKALEAAEANRTEQSIGSGDGDDDANAAIP